MLQRRECRVRDASASASRAVSNTLLASSPSQSSSTLAHIFVPTWAPSIKFERTSRHCLSPSGHTCGLASVSGMNKIQRLLRIDYGSVHAHAIRPHPFLRKAFQTSSSRALSESERPRAVIAQSRAARAMSCGSSERPPSSIDAIDTRPRPMQKSYSPRRCLCLRSPTLVVS